jgi:DNA-binding PadR family transcriptional regulator
MNTAPSYRSPWALTILSLLYEREMHPYEIRRLVRQRGKDELVDLRPGSLYRTIERLERARLIEPVETTREGRFPERTVYRITEHGQDELKGWMRELLSATANDYPRLAQAMSVLAVLETDDARLELERRVLHLEGEVASMEIALRQLDRVGPRLFKLDNEYALALRRAELTWVKGLVEDMRTGRLAWTREQIRTEHADLASRRPLDITAAVEEERME